MPKRRKSAQRKQKMRPQANRPAPKPVGTWTRLWRRRRWEIAALAIAVVLGVPGLVLAWVAFESGEETSQALERMELHNAQRDETYRDLFRQAIPGVFGDSLDNAAQAEAIGDFEEALDHLRRAEALARSGDEKVRVYLRFGNLYEDLGRSADARRAFETALGFASEAADGSLRAAAMGSLANQLKDRGDLARAEELYSDALELFRTLTDRRGEAKTLHNLGLLSARKGDDNSALVLLDGAYELNGMIGNAAGQVNNKTALARVYTRLGSIQNAKNALDDAGRLARDHGFSLELMRVGWEEAAFYRNVIGDYELARASGEAALRLARQLGRQYDESEILGLLGYIERSAARLEAALAYHKAALDMKRALRDRLGEGAAHLDLAFVYQNNGDPGQTIGHAQTAFEIGREVGDKYLEGAALSTWGVTLTGTGSPKEGLRLQCQSLRAFETLGLSYDIQVERDIITRFHDGTPEKLCRGIK